MKLGGELLLPSWSWESLLGSESLPESWGEGVSTLGASNSCDWNDYLLTVVANIDPDATQFNRFVWVSDRLQNVLAYGFGTGSDSLKKGVGLAALSAGWAKVILGYHWWWWTWTCHRLLKVRCLDHGSFSGQIWVRCSGAEERALFVCCWLLLLDKDSIVLVVP